MVFVTVTPASDRRVLAILLLYEWVWYSLHAILRTNEHYGGSSADHQPQLPGVFCQLQLVIWIWIDNDGQVVKTHKNLVKRHPMELLTTSSATEQCVGHFLI